MFEPDSRAVPLDQLRPLPGYRLEAAVATSFTLSLQTALVPPLAFAAFTVRDTADPVAVLEAVRSCTDRVDIFCQAGQIAVPRAHSDLMAFLEPMVHPVQAPRRGYLFHPKVWFLHYREDGGDATRYRLLVATRNLVDSTAWDLAVTLDGVPGEPDPTNRPLAAFLRSLPDMTVTALAPERAERVRDLADRAMGVAWELPEGAQRVDFHAWGIPDLAVTANFMGYRHLVMAPFLDADGLRHVAPGSNGDLHVVARAEAFDAMNPDDLPTETPGGPTRLHVLDPLAGLSEPDEEGESPTSDGCEPDQSETTQRGTSATPAPQRSGLHAKVTIVERNNREAHVYVGSPNATGAAYSGNVEFAVELTGRSKDLGVRAVLGGTGDAGGGGDGDTTQGLSSILQPYARHPVDTAEEDRRRELARVLRNLAAVRLTAHVVPEGDAYRQHLTSQGALPDVPEGFTAWVALLTAPALTAAVTVRTRLDATLGPVGMTAVTPFVVLTVADPGGITVSSVVHVVLQGDPPQRLDAILAGQIDTPAKFLHFLRLLLALSGESSGWSVGDATAAGAWGPAEVGGVLESLAAALARGGHHLDAMDGLIDRLTRTEAGRAVIPDGFTELWEQVRIARETLDQEAHG